MPKAKRSPKAKPQRKEKPDFAQTAFSDVWSLDEVIALH